MARKGKHLYFQAAYIGVGSRKKHFMVEMRLVASGEDTQQEPVIVIFASDISKSVTSEVKMASAKIQAEVASQAREKFGYI